MGKIKKKEFCPNYAIPPGETLRETLDAMGMSQAELAERTGRPKKTINEIISGKAAITAETALQLERVLGVPASFWTNLERNYQETLARLKEEEKLRFHEEWAKTLPIRELIKAKWLSKEDSIIKQLKSFLNFFGVAGVEEWKEMWLSPQTVYRKSNAFQSNPAAVAAWLRKGEIEAAKLRCDVYNAALFKSSLARIRELTPQPPEVFVQEIMGISSKAGVAVIFVPEIPGSRVFGATRWLTPTKSLIQLSLRGKSDDHLWFTFFHESAHILIHGKKNVFIEADDREGQNLANAEKEKEADKFAQEFLIPVNEYKEFARKNIFSHTSIRKFAGKLGIAPGIVVGRLQHDSIIQYSQFNDLKNRFRFAEA